MTPSQPKVANILGAARAEADTAMLAKAFVETADYQALVQTDDFNFVVGRRGAGKSALFSKVQEHFANETRMTVVGVTPPEHDTMDMQRLLLQCGSSYRQLRALSRLAWKIHLLVTAAKCIEDHYRASKSSAAQFLTQYLETHSAITTLRGAAQCNAIVRFGMLHGGAGASTEIPAFLARIFDVEALKAAVDEALRELRHSVVVMYDGLDEGWEPAVSSTAILGGLALAVADLVDAHVPLRPVLFVRDNMFRALATEDSDFTRHIEGNTLRLHWDEPSLPALRI